MNAELVAVTAVIVALVWTTVNVCIDFVLLVSSRVVKNDKLILIYLLFYWLVVTAALVSSMYLVVRYTHPRWIGIDDTRTGRDTGVLRHDTSRRADNGAGDQRATGGLRSCWSNHRSVYVGPQARTGYSGAHDVYSSDEERQQRVRPYALGLWKDGTVCRIRRLT